MDLFYYLLHCMTESYLTKSKLNTLADITQFPSHFSVQVIKNWKNTETFHTLNIIYILTSQYLLSPIHWMAHSSIVGWGTMLQAGRSRVRFPMRSLDFFNWPNPSSRTMALGLTQPLTEMSTRNLPGGCRAAGVQGWQPYCHLWDDCLEDVGA
jgi:hypothetical protein